MEFTIFYDGACPLCSIEINHLKKRDEANKLAFVDINHAEFSERYPDLDWQAMNERIHGRLADGTWLIGLDVTHKAWSLVGKGWLYAPLRWPLIRGVADTFYLWFARHRHEIAYLLTRKKRSPSACESKLR